MLATKPRVSINPNASFVSFAIDLLLGDGSFRCRTKANGKKFSICLFPKAQLTFCRGISSPYARSSPLVNILPVHGKLFIFCAEVKSRVKDVNRGGCQRQIVDTVRHLISSAALNQAPEFFIFLEQIAKRKLLHSFM